MEISPLNTLVRIEGGSCYDHHKQFSAQSGAESEPEEVIEVGGITITVEGGSSEADYWSGESCWGALDVSLALKDGTVLETPSTGIGSRCEDGVNPDGVVKTPFGGEILRLCGGQQCPLPPGHRSQSGRLHPGVRRAHRHAIVNMRKAAPGGAAFCGRAGLGPAPTKMQKPVR